MKFIFHFCLFLFFGSLQSQSLPSSSFAPKYYVQNNDSFTSGTITNKKINKFLQKQGFIFIPSSVFKPQEQDGYDTLLNVTDTIRTNSFWIFSTEISNAQFKDFLQQTGSLNAPDTLDWLKPESNNEAYKNYYYQLPAFDGFPVVGIDYNQCMNWCKWKAAQLNNQLQKQGIDDLEITITLPLESEWIAAYEYAITGALEKYKTMYCYQGNGPAYIAYFTGCGTYKANFGTIEGIRGTNLKNQNLGVTGYLPAKVHSYPAPFKIHNLGGNVAEWTRTPAKGNLFNNLQYIYTSSGKIIFNEITRIDSSQLKKLLYKESELENHYVVKGGSWAQDIYYLQALSSCYLPKNGHNAATGFRPVLYVRSKSGQ